MVVSLNPKDVADARKPERRVKRESARLCIEKPPADRFSRHAGLPGGVFASHLSVSQQIARPKGMACQQLTTESTA